MTLLNRSLAPITDEIWEVLDEEARDYLSLQLTGRKIVDVEGPLGSDFAAVNSGRQTKLESPVEGVQMTERKVLPLAEIKVPFTLDLNELEAVTRGAKDIELDNLLEAADKVIAAEDGAVFKGKGAEHFAGIINKAEFNLNISDKPQEFIAAAVEGINNMKNAGVGGPFSLVLSEDIFRVLFSSPDSGYPLHKRLGDIDIEKVIVSPLMESEGLLLSARGEDFKLILGQDLTLGFEERNGSKLEFFFTESFVTRVISPEAAVYLN